MDRNRTLLVVLHGIIVLLTVLGAGWVTSRGVVAPVIAVAAGSITVVATGVALVVWLDDRG